MSDTAPLSTITPFPNPPTGNLLGDSLAHPQPTSNPIAAPPSMAAMGSFHKESAPIPQPVEYAPLVEVRESEPLPPEVEGYLQKLNAAGEIKLPEPITHDGNVLLASTEAQIVKEKVVLPMTQSGLQTGLKQKVTHSARWLAEWCVRLIKMMRDGVKYAPESDHG